MAKYIADLLSKIETPGMPPIREVKVMNEAGTPAALVTMTPETVTDILVQDGLLIIVFDNA